MASRRRISVDFSTAQAVACIHDTIDTLHKLWDEVSMDDHKRTERVAAFYGHLKTLMTDMLESEREMVANVKLSIEECLPEVTGLRKELGLLPFEVSNFPRGSIALYKALDKERERLTSLKEDRLNGQKQMISELQALAARIGANDEVVDVNKLELVDDETMREWQERMKTYSETLDMRMREAYQWQMDMQRWAAQTGAIPTSELLSTFIDIDIDDPDRVLDTTFMSEFQEAHQIAQVEFQEWCEQAEFDYTEAYIKLSALWDECHIPEMERRFPPRFNPSSQTAADVENIKKEVEKLARFHEERAAVYGKMKEWKELWAEKLEYESHVNDKSRYQNRGGQLQVILQRQKFIETRIPSLLEELRYENKCYLDGHPEAPILFEGVDPCEYIEWAMREYKAQKEVERLRKKQTISTNLKETRTTPRKRTAHCVLSTPCSSAKLAKTQSHAHFKPNVNQRIGPGSPFLRFHNLSCYASTTSLHSVITPVRPPVKIGPKTSSPKEFDERFPDRCVSFPTKKNHPPPSSKASKSLLSRLPTPRKPEHQKH